MERMTRRWLVAVGLLAAACGATPQATVPVQSAVASTGQAPTTVPAGTPPSGGSPSPIASTPSPATGFVPGPDRPIPGRPTVLAAALTRTDRALRESVRGWVAAGSLSTEAPPSDVVLLVLYEQRIYRFLGQRPAL